jgi:ribose 5-phosphate isomerase B
MISIGIGCDHAGLLLKRELISLFSAPDFKVTDVGTHTAESVDYPDYASKVCELVTSTAVQFGILVCGSGTGMSIAANKKPRIRAALCRGEFEARMARAHNDANVLCLGERITGLDLAKAIAKVFVETAFEGGRHQRRVDKLEP